jgi:ribosomal-protein-alanine N-acetyltransferase
MNLETDRLILDAWQSADWTALQPIATDPDVMRHITGGVAWNEEQIRSFVDGQVRQYAERGYCRWKLLEKPAGAFIGFCGVGFWRNEPDPEIGWWLMRARWGRGLATEAARAALADAVERARLDRIISIARPENAASIRIMEKLGLHFELAFENGGTQLVRYAIGRAQYGVRQRAAAERGK